jgi:uncharacterized protein YecT (DUF1311 family)
MSRTILLLLLVFISVTAFAQAPQAAPREPSPAWRVYWAKQEAIRKRGTIALNAEQERIKSELCADATSTVDIGHCYEHELEITDGNRIAYVRAIGGLLRLAAPSESGEATKPAPVEKLPLDVAEDIWLQYREKGCRSVSDQSGGSLSGDLYVTCLLEVTQNHIIELADLYKDLWH